MGGGGFVLLGAFYFGRLVTFFFPNNPLIKKGKKENEELTSRQKEFIEFLEKASNQSKENNETMPDVKLNSGSDDVGMKFKIIGISVTFGLNAIIFIWYFFFSGLT